MQYQQNYFRIFLHLFKYFCLKHFFGVFQKINFRYHTYANPPNTARPDFKLKICWAFQHFVFHHERETVRIILFALKRGNVDKIFVLLFIEV